MSLPCDCGLSPDVIQRIQEVFSRFSQIDSVLLYGSRAKGTFRQGSDIDLAIVLKPDASTDSRLITDIAEALDDLDLIYSIDLSLLQQIDNPALVERIKRDGVLFYA